MNNIINIRPHLEKYNLSVLIDISDIKRIKIVENKDYKNLCYIIKFYKNKSKYLNIKEYEIIINHYKKYKLKQNIKEF